MPMLSLSNGSEASSEDISPAIIKDSSTPSGFILKLYQMVNGAPDDLISVSDLHRHLFFRMFETYWRTIIFKKKDMPFDLSQTCVVTFRSSDSDRIHFASDMNPI
jgi:hypothetical protein